MWTANKDANSYVKVSCNKRIAQKKNLYANLSNGRQRGLVTVMVTFSPRFYSKITKNSKLCMLQLLIKVELFCKITLLFKFFFCIVNSSVKHSQPNAIKCLQHILKLLYFFLPLCPINNKWSVIHFLWYYDSFNININYFCLDS